MPSPSAEQTPPAIRRVHAVVNPVSGGVGPGAVDELAAIFAELGVAHRITELEPRSCRPMVQAALDEAPDAIVVLGGDGTARLVAEMCGPDGPLVAPLSAGTMNKLGRALYGARTWREALVEVLSGGQARWMPGGEVGGRAFFCGAVLGSLALFAPAREAIRARELSRAWRRAVLASRKAFLSRVSYELNGTRGDGVALSLICPADEGEGWSALKAAVLEPPDEDAGPTASVRLALSTLLGDWRDDPEITIPCVSGRAWARTSIPIMLDGEFFRLGREVEFRFRPQAFRALAPRAAGEPSG